MTSTSSQTDQASQQRAELRAGLLSLHAFVSPKFFYDTLGSTLFDAICELPEYYPTRTEAGIFTESMARIAESVGQGATLIDLGAGNCAKAARLFPLLQPQQYVPIDISADYLQVALNQLRARFPEIEMHGLGLDFSSALALPPEVRADKRLFFYPGSSIGNFSPQEAEKFLHRIRAACRHDGGLLIGVDLIKDKAVLDAAYDDALGVTAAFNLNLLRHVNHILEANFDVRDWRHIGFFNTEKSRIEMHLEARHTVDIVWSGGHRRFDKGERIHTENSYKYTQESFLHLLRKTGFGASTVWTDPAHWFAVIHAKAVD